MSDAHLYKVKCEYCKHISQVCAVSQQLIGSREFMKCAECMLLIKHEILEELEF